MVVGVLVVMGKAGAQGLTLEFIGTNPGIWADINDRGQVVMVSGDASGARVGRYTDGVGLELLGPASSAIFRPRIGNSGQFAWEDSDGHSYRWTDGVGAVNVDTLGVGYMAATGINDYGHVVGVTHIQGHRANWVYGVEGPAAVVVPSLSGPGEYLASGINNVGQIVGEREPIGSHAHAVRFTPGVGVVDLGTLGGLESVGHGINARGDVFGWSTATDGFDHVFLYTDSGGMENLGPLAIHVTLNDINDSGWIAARSTLANHAVVWTRETGFVDLNSLLSAGSGAELFEALAINNHNQLAVRGVVDGQYGVYRVTVHQLPGPAGALPLIGGLVLSYRRRRTGA
jgi:probable HAF family extracellular repeat protein